jgi:hypothetical protein
MIHKANRQVEATAPPPLQISSSHVLQRHCSSRGGAPGRCASPGSFDPEHMSTPHILDRRQRSEQSWLLFSLFPPLPPVEESLGAVLHHPMISDVHEYLSRGSRSLITGTWPVEAAAPRRCSFDRDMFHYVIVSDGAGAHGRCASPGSLALSV